MSYSIANIQIDDRALDHLLNSPSGDVGRYMAARGSRLVLAAKKQVGGRTGRLRSSIHMRHDRRGEFQEIRVGTFEPGIGYALYHHEGTKAEVILPNNGRFLSFVIRGRRIFTTRVSRGPVPANRYLVDPMRRIFR